MGSSLVLSAAKPGHLPSMGSNIYCDGGLVADAARSGGWGGDPTTPTFFSDDTMGMMCGAFSAWEYGLGGSQSRKFIMGQCKQVSGDPYGGAVVYGFRSSDGLPIGSVASDDKGRYELGCPNTPNDAHFLVARAAAAPEYAGVTVNNIVPTWRDGT